MAPRQSMERRLTKTLYLRGLNCRKALWLTVHDPQKAAPPAPFQEHIMRQGTNAGVLARRQFRGGKLIFAPSYEPDRALWETASALHSSAPVLFEGAFLFQGIFLRVDVLRRGRAGLWDLIEVKSTTQVKSEHLPEVAVQKYVLEGCGLNLGRLFLMHLNRECTCPDLSDLFILEDITDAIAGEYARVPETLQLFRRLLREPSEPEVRIGPQCTELYRCPFFDYCWEAVPAVSIFNIPRLKAQQKIELVEADILAVEDVPSGYPLPPEGRRFVNLYLQRQPQIEWPGIRRELDALAFPLYFLDFETDSPAVPRFDGMHPYDKLPYQYSLHVLEADGRLEHFEYLHDETSDPRLSLARSLTKRLGGEGTVVAYSAGFEKGVLLGLAGGMAQRFPELSRPLASAADRLWDLLGIFRSYYFDPAFGGSNSLKDVLPALLPGFSYDSLQIQNGEQALLAWNRLIDLEDGQEKRSLAAALKQYCRQDTLAMVEIYRLLRRKSAQNAFRFA